MSRKWSAVLLWLAFAVQPLCADEGLDFFEAKIRPLLIEHCYRCHSGEKSQGGLLLDSRNGWEQGGESGPTIKPGDVEASLLIQAIRRTDDVSPMPPDTALPPQVIATFEEWIRRGAPDPRIAVKKLGGMARTDANRWWSFQPLQPVVAPTLEPSDSRLLTEIDRFIEAPRRAAGLTASAPADRRTLIRRATYDLTGLPPTPSEVAAFVADSSPDAYPRLIDRLLQSPRYGERWGRHWLDLVRYADTAGENSDHPLPHAWKYRNWVIDAFNRDQPYDEFVRDQIAGDLLADQGPPEAYARRVIATGYLALARRFDHDSDKSMHLTHEDGIDTLGRAFQGLSIGCARCHDHKYDAITAHDYYALYGILDSTRLSFPGCEAKQQPRDLVPLVTPAEWEQVVRPYQEQLAAIDGQLQQAGAAQREIGRRVQQKLNDSRLVLSEGEVAEGEDVTFPELPEVEINAGELLMLSVTPLGNHGGDSTGVEWSIEEVGGNQRRWQAREDLIGDLLSGNPHVDHYGQSRTWWLLDTRDQPSLLPEAIANLQGQAGLNAWRNGDTPSVFVTSGEKEVPVWTKLPGRSLFVHPAPNGNVAIGWLAPLSGKVRITARIWDAHNGGPNGVGWVLERFATNLNGDLAELATAAELPRQLSRQRAELVLKAPQQEVAFAVSEGTPADARLHVRGDPLKLGETVPRRWLEVLGGTPITSATSSGRLDLAQWLTAPENPLTARVMVNRIWLHHFGRGLVKSPNDFGTRGTLPTHPELLDWLAQEFIQSGWSIKSLHRQIMLSATYQQSCRGDALSETRDVNNDLYWRFDRRRLTAEELRDSLLMVSGQLDFTPGSAHPIPASEGWSYSQHVPFAGVPETRQRSVYQLVVRNRRHPFMALFDGADPNATTPQRQVTTVPTQALYFLNDAFFHEQSDALARRLGLDAAENDWLSSLFELVLQRDPTPQERCAAVEFMNTYRDAASDLPADQQAAAARSAWCRVLLANNEFLFLD